MIDSLKRWFGMAHGAYDLVRHPSYREPWGGPFNNQLARQALFQTIRAATKPWAIIETGAYRGSTTEFFAGAGVPVFSVEADVHAFGFVCARLWRRRKVTLLLDDSRVMLRSLIGGPLWSPQGGAHPFFYLDAHWENDLPLAEEIEIVFSRCPDAVVMIDDYEVPDDNGYTFDDYGPGKKLNADYILPAVEKHGLAVFYPSTPSRYESGGRRGCVVLVKADVLGPKMAELPLLRRG